MPPVIPAPTASCTPRRGAHADRPRDVAAAATRGQRPLSAPQAPESDPRPETPRPPPRGGNGAVRAAGPRIRSTPLREGPPGACRGDAYVAVGRRDLDSGSPMRWRDGGCGATARPLPVSRRAALRHTPAPRAPSRTDGSCRAVGAAAPWPPRPCSDPAWSPFPWRERRRAPPGSRRRVSRRRPRRASPAPRP